MCSGRDAAVEFLLALAFIPIRVIDARSLLPGGTGARIWTFLTYALLHADWAHLIFNTLWLAAFGSAVAWRFGAVRFLGFSAVGASRRRRRSSCASSDGHRAAGRRLGRDLGAHGRRGPVRLRRARPLHRFAGGRRRGLSPAGAAPLRGGPRQAGADLPRRVVRDKPAVRTVRRRRRRRVGGDRLGGTCRRLRRRSFVLSGFRSGPAPRTRISLSHLCCGAACQAAARAPHRNGEARAEGICGGRAKGQGRRNGDWLGCPGSGRYSDDRCPHSRIEGS